MAKKKKDKKTKGSSGFAQKLSIDNIFHNEKLNAYTIEKNGVKKLIYQVPWYDGEEFGGLIEFSLPIPFDMPHYVRQPKVC